jgi:hypothetical protein
MYYNFEWDTDDNNSPLYADANYTLQFTGIREVTLNDGTKSEVTDTLGTYTVKSNEAVSVVTSTGETEQRYNIVQLNADNWNYDKVKVRALRVGTNNAIGRASEKTYDVYRRLQTITSPDVTIETESSAGLNYNIAWTARNSSDDCAGYRVFMTYTEKAETTNDDSTTTTTDVTKLVQLTDELIPSVADQTSYSYRVDLEQYTGVTARIYVVAYPYYMADGVTPTGNYQSSANGNQTIVNIAVRAEAPQVRFTGKWNPYSEDGSDAVTEDEFLNGAVTINAALAAIGNDELYNPNIQGVVFESKAAAQKWIDRLNTATTDSEKIKMVEELMALNGIEGVDNSSAELAFGLFDMIYSNSDTTDGINWLNYTRSITSSNSELSYKNAGHYVLPLARRITTASAAAYSLWSWDGRTDSSYPGVIKLPRVKLNTPVPTISTTSSSCTGKGIIYNGLDTDGNPMDEVEVADIALPLRKHTWMPSETIKADAYDISVLSGTPGIDRMDFRLEYDEAEEATDTTDAVNAKVLIQPFTSTQATATTSATTTYGTAIDISGAFESAEKAKTVFGENAVLTFDTEGTYNDNAEKVYADVITLTAENEEPVEVARREYIGSISDDTEFTYTYTIPGSEVTIEGSVAEGTYKGYSCKITQSSQIVLKADAKGITEYSIIYAGVDYATDNTPVTFKVYAGEDDDEGTSCNVNSVSSNYMELDIKAVIKDKANPQYVSSGTGVSYIW